MICLLPALLAYFFMKNPKQHKTFLSYIKRLMNSPSFTELSIEAISINLFGLWLSYTIYGYLRGPYYMTMILMTLHYTSAANLCRMLFHIPQSPGLIISNILPARSLLLSLSMYPRAVFCFIMIANAAGQAALARVPTQDTEQLEKNRIAVAKWFKPHKNLPWLYELRRRPNYAACKSCFYYKAGINDALTKGEFKLVHNM
jgi:hypothetical protein